MRAQPLEVHPAVSLLVGEHEGELAAQLRVELGPEQQRPGEELHGLQLVVREAAQTDRAGSGRAELIGPRQPRGPAA